MKFKIGDKVKYIGNLYRSPKNLIGVITRHDQSGMPYLVEYQGMEKFSYWHTNNELKLCNSHIVRERLGVK